MYGNWTVAQLKAELRKQTHLELEKSSIGRIERYLNIKKFESYDRNNILSFQKCTKVCLTEERFGAAKGQDVMKYTWTTGSPFSVSVINYGGIITNILVPDKNNTVNDVVLGFDDIDSWVCENSPYFGCIVGRCANIISNASFYLNGVQYLLPNNSGPNSLHGGLIGFDKVVWNSKVDDTRLMLSYLSDDCEEGYPGDVIATVIYEVTDDNTLHVDLMATCTKPTVVNLTNHSYFNLAGHDAGPNGLYDHQVTINADHITDGGNCNLICNSAFDLRVPRKLDDLRPCLPDLFDNNYCINLYGFKSTVKFVGCAFHAKSGRSMEIYSDAPGLQFYTGNFLPSECDQPIKGKSGCEYVKHGGFCLQPQFYPDSINYPLFPSPILNPGYVYQRKIKYVFGVGASSEEHTCDQKCCDPCPNKKPKSSCDK